MFSFILRKCKSPFRSRKYSTNIEMKKTHSVYMFGDNSFKQCHNKLKESIYTPFKLDINNVNIKSVESGYTHSFILSDESIVYGWGLNEIGQLGKPLSSGIEIPSPIIIEVLSNAKITSLSCGRGHTLALTENNLVLSFGSNDLGQLGYGSTDKESHPLPKVVESLRGIEIKKVMCGLDHSIALSSDGVVREWGFGRLGQLASSYLQDTSIPLPIENLPFIIDIDSSHDHTLAIDIDGNVWIWGMNDCNLSDVQDEEGISIIKLRKMPIDEKVIKARAGSSHDIVLTEHGNCYTWGFQPCLGIGNEDSSVPLKIDFFSDNDIKIKDFSCGSNHTLLLTEDNQVYSWGNGASGKLGHGNDEDQNYPKLIEFFKDKKVTHVKATINHSIVVCEDI